MRKSKLAMSAQNRAHFSNQGRVVLAAIAALILTSNVSSRKRLRLEDCLEYKKEEAKYLKQLEEVIMSEDLQRLGTIEDKLQKGSEIEPKRADITKGTNIDNPAQRMHIRDENFKKESVVHYQSPSESESWDNSGYDDEGNPLDHPELSGRWLPLKILADISRLRPLRNSQKNRRVYQSLTTRLLPDVLKYLQSTYLVREKAYMRLTQENCFEVKGLPGLQNRKIYAHTILIVTFTDDKSDENLAWAEVCAFHPLTGRPVAGQINLNLASMKDFGEKKYKEHFETIIHEIHHILGINLSVFKFFVNPKNFRRRRKSEIIEKTRKFGKSYRVLRLSGLVEMARNHFGCESIDHVPLENEGSSSAKGTHFEKLWFGNELMIADDYYNIKISKFTLKLLEESGWYRANYNMGQRYSFMKRAGCGLLDYNCRRLKDICDPRNKGHICSRDFTGVGHCTRKDSFSDGCPIFGWEDISCIEEADAGKTVPGWFGPNSRCFLGDYQGGGAFANGAVYAFCAKPICYKDDSGLYQLKVRIKGELFECPSSGKKLYLNPMDQDAGFFLCPDIGVFCDSFAKSCKNDCSMKGRCQSDGRCWCYAGYTGEDCSEVDTKVRHFDFSLPYTPERCDPKCLNGGRCFHGKCECSADYSGVDCAIHDIFEEKQAWGALHTVCSALGMGWLGWELVWG